MPFCWQLRGAELPADLSTCLGHCNVLHTQIVCPALVPGSPDQYGHVSCWKCNKCMYAMKMYMVVEALLHTCISSAQMESSTHHTYLSRMQDTSRLSTSQASIFSSFEMNGMCILVYGVINLISTWVRILRSRSATTQIIFIQHQDYQHQLHVISGFHQK